MTAIPLIDARLCVDTLESGRLCNCIHDGKACPECGSRQYLRLARVLRLDDNNRGGRCLGVLTGEGIQ